MTTKRSKQKSYSAEEVLMHVEEMSEEVFAEFATLLTEAQESSALEVHHARILACVKEILESHDDLPLATEILDAIYPGMDFALSEALYIMQTEMDAPEEEVE